MSDYRPDVPDPRDPRTTPPAKPGSGNGPHPEDLDRAAEPPLDRTGPSVPAPPAQLFPRAAPASRRHPKAARHRRTPCRWSLRPLGSGSHPSRHPLGNLGSGANAGREPAWTGVCDRRAVGLGGLDGRRHCAGSLRCTGPPLRIGLGRRSAGTERSGARDPLPQATSTPTAPTASATAEPTRPLAKTKRVNWQKLKPTMCFLAPETSGVTTVKVVDCRVEHDAEVMLNTSLRSPKDLARRQGDEHHAGAGVPPGVRGLCRHRI